MHLLAFIMIEDKKLFLYCLYISIICILTPEIKRNKKTMFAY